MQHYPVMLKEVIDNFELQTKKIIVDCTFGAGGYSSAILNNSSAKVIAIDKDPEAIIRADSLIKKFPDRFFIFQNDFSNISQVVKEAGFDKVDGIVLDIGVSSFQLDDPARGFSFMTEGPLDMRMSKQGPTAKDVIESYPQEQLAEIFRNYGEERHSNLIAKKIKEAIADGVVFETTLDLANFISKNIKGKQKIHPATRVFQALRIEVNQELDQLAKTIDSAVNLLNIDGRLIVVTFHSLEDRIVKTKFAALTGKRTKINKYAKSSKVSDDENKHDFISTVKKFLIPSEEEVSENIRSRSAKMRIIERVK